MAQISTTTSNIQGVSVSSLQTSINNLRTKFVSGSTIYAADLNDVVSLYNTWITHNHSVTDTLFISFGDIPTYPSDVTEPRTTSSVKGKTNSSTSSSVGNNITASLHNTVAGLVNGIRTHTHTITDKVQT